MGMTYLADYAKFDIELAKKAFEAPVRNTFWQENSYSGDWLAGKRNTAVLEAHRERVRQVYARVFNAAKTSSEWVQGLMYVEAAKDVEELKRVCNSFDIVWRDSGDMITKNEEIAKLQAEINKLNAKVTKLQHGRWGVEPANGSVFKIERRYERNGVGYTFSAVKAGGLWYLTGTKAESAKAYNWEGLKEWAGKYSRVWRMTAAEELVD